MWGVAASLGMHALLVGALLLAPLQDRRVTGPLLVGAAPGAATRGAPLQIKLLAREEGRASGADDGAAPARGSPPAAPRMGEGAAVMTPNIGP